MHKTWNWLLAGAAVLALAGTAAVAEARAPAMHELTVQLPGGGIEHIRYSGDVRPDIVVLPDAAWADPFAAPFAQPMADFWPAPAFAGLDRISAQMDREMTAMLHDANALARSAGPAALEASFAHLPRGAVEYSQFSSWSGNGACVRSIQMTRSVNGEPHIISRTSGHCGGASAATRSANLIPTSLVAPQPSNHLHI